MPKAFPRVGYGVTPMSRLSQHSSRRRPRTGKPLDLSSPNSLSKKKTPKRKTLSSRYSAILPSKRRKLGLNTIRDPVISLGETHHAPEACHAAVSPKSTNASEVPAKEKEARHSGTKGRARKTKAKARARARARARGANARVKASRGLKSEVCPIAKLVDSEDISNEEADSEIDLFHPNATTEVGKQGLETIEAGALDLARTDDLDATHADPRQSSEKHVLVANRGPGRKGSKRFSPLALSGARALRDYNSNDKNIPTSTGPQVQEFSVQDATEGSSLHKQDPSLLEGSFLRPRRKAKKKAKVEEHRLPPWDYVGKRVVVYWPHAKAWYAGKVIMYDDTSKKHKIKYDDSDEECISFRRHKVILEKSLPVQLADGQNKRVISAQRVQFPEEEVVASKQVQVDRVVGDRTDDKCVVEDNALLSAFVPRHRVREGSHETICNGSVMPVGVVKGLDAAATNNTTVLKSSKKSILLTAQDNTGRTPAADKGTGGGKEAFVYVRRTKGRRKADVLTTDLVLDGRIHESNATATALEQHTSRKRKSCQSLLQLTSQTEFPDCNFYNDESSFSDTPAICGTHGNGSNMLDCASRKRPKRSLRKLVSQSSIAVGMEISQDPEALQDQLRKQRNRRTRGKLSRKHKLNNERLTARNRRLPTKRVLCLAEGAEGQAFEVGSSTLCHDAVKVYNLVVSTRDMRKSESASLFLDTIYLMLPTIPSELFTWQLFSILTCLHFCDGGSFDEIFNLNGSLRDWMGIVRILVHVIKAVPLSTYMNGRQWQCIILHEFWKSIQQGEPGKPDMGVSLPSEVETLVSEHLLDASVNCGMTNRGILNLFVCYFIKPYIFAIICEKGMSIQVAVQQFLLHIRSNDRGTTCLRQSVERFLLQPGCADEGFSSYLMLFLRSTNWCTEGGLFLRQMKEWITETRRAGCAKSWNPILAIKKLDHLVWRVIATHVVNGGRAMDELKSKTVRESKWFRMGQEDTESEEFFLKCSRYAAVGSSPFDQECGSSNGPHNGNFLNSALLLAARLQKRLNMTDGKEFGSHPKTVLLPFSKASITDVPAEETKLNGQSGSAVEDASDFTISAGFSNLVSRGDHSAFPSWNSSLVAVNAPSVHVKVEPDMNFSRRNSSITTESNSAGIKEESSVETYVRQEPLNILLLKSDSVGQTHVGYRAKTDEQHFSVQMDRDYYDNEFSKNVKVVTKGRPRHRGERQRPLLKKRPAYFCIADLLFLGNDCVERKPGARVELQFNADSSFLIAVHADGESVEQKVLEGGMLAKNPPELSWNSGNGWTLQFSDREQWELFRCMYNELCSQAMRATCVKEIPVPVVKETETFYGDAQPSSSIRPFFAIKSPGEEIETAFRTGRVLYDLDSEDEAWMAAINKVSGDSGRVIISDDTLEQIIDRLEKETYKRGEETITLNDAVELCQGLALADSLQAVHAYWCSKRLAKGMSLLRYFQPPLWEQYQEELRAWENRMQQYSPDAQNTLIDLYPRPILSAFCLQSRSFDTLDNGKRMLRQRSQRKIRPTSRSSSEDSQRLPVYHCAESNRHLTHDSEYPHSSTPPYQHLDHGHEEEGLPDSAKVARAKAVEARRVAESGDASAESEAFEGRMSRLLTSCTRLFNRGNDSSDDEPPSYSGQVCRDVGEEFLEAFSRKCSLNGMVAICKGQDKARDDNLEEASPRLPVFVKGSSYAWNGSSLLEYCG
ncbi:hypothetical protein GOP47_0003640 [Adiantum capillus-veneris]|uniref:Enhancer of polycomb-like protein n=1 Tax=Adiantum capillus-veneris TaxID=13818 RepID=A0A9D4V7N5_ADICA|nr:hypothetical protein GOP47_0003640 [Adiantum capillus-veneris]